MKKEPFDPLPYREVLRKRAALERRRIIRRAARAKDFLPALVAAFRNIDPGIEKIVLFGSLARGTPRREGFDIDVAVRTKRYFALVSWAFKQEWKIDVVDIDELEGTSLEGIEAKGKTLYEKD